MGTAYDDQSGQSPSPGRSSREISAKHIRQINPINQYAETGPIKTRPAE